MLTQPQQLLKFHGDIDGDGKITPEKDKVVLGDPFPSWTGGMTNTFTYKGFDLSFFIYTRQGVFMKSAYHSELVSDFGGTRYNVGLSGRLAIRAGGSRLDL